MVALTRHIRKGHNHLANAEDGYVQVLGSDVSHYGAFHSRPCSEYSCCSVPAGFNTMLAGTARLVPASITSASDYGSLAVYDSDNCSVGYYYHNNSNMPVLSAAHCLHTPQQAGMLKHFGDTLATGHGGKKSESSNVGSSTVSDSGTAVPSGKLYGKTKMLLGDKGSTNSISV